MASSGPQLRGPYPESRVAPNNGPLHPKVDHVLMDPKVDRDSKPLSLSGAPMKQKSPLV